VTFAKMTTQTNNDDSIIKTALLIDSENRPETAQITGLPIQQHLFFKYFLDLTKPKSAIPASPNQQNALEDLIIEDAAQIVFPQPKKTKKKAKRKKVTDSNRAIEDTVINLTNVTYKHILFCDPNALLFNIRAEKGQEFQHSKGKFTSAKDLYLKIDTVPDAELKKYLKNNDFFRWLKGTAFKGNKKIKDLANAINKTQSKDDLRVRIEKEAVKVRDKSFNRKKGGATFEARIASEMFLANLCPNLINLIPKLSNKQDIKLLKLVDRYITQFQNDPTRSELVSFLLNPSDFVQKKEQEGRPIDHKFDFAKYFKNNITFQTSYISNIQQKTEAIETELASSEIESKSDFEKYTQWKKEIEKFIAKHKENKSPQMKKAKDTVSFLERKINRLQNKINDQLIIISKANINLDEDIPKAKKILKKSPNIPNLKSFKRAQRKLKECQSINVTIDTGFIEDYSKFIRNRDAFEAIVHKRDAELREFFDSQNTQYRTLLDAKVRDTQQDIDELWVQWEDIQKTINLAGNFYETEDADILNITAEVMQVVTNYHTLKKARTKDITDFIKDLSIAETKLEEQQNTPELFTIDYENTNQQRTFRTIMELESTISKKAELFESYESDNGLADVLADFKHTQPAVQEKIDGVKQLIKDSIDTELQALDEEVKQPYDFSQEIVLLNIIKQKTKTLNKHAKIIEYSKKDKNLVQITNLADLKISQIKSNITAGKKKITQIDKHITKQYQQIQEKSQNITQKGALKKVLSILSKFSAKIAESEKWQGDVQLDPGIKKLEERVNEIQKEVDSTVDAAIEKTAKRTRKLKPRIQKPEKTNIIKTLNSLNNRQIHLTRLSKGKYAEKTASHLEEVQGLINKAETTLANFKSGVDQNLNDVVAALSIDFEWSKDQKKIAAQKTLITEIEKDAADLAYEEKTPDFISAKALAQSKELQLIEVIKTRKDILAERMIENNASATQFSIIQSSLADARLIDKTNETINKLKTNIDQHSAWKKDSEYTELFKKAKTEISQFRTESQTYILNRISSLDEVVTDIAALASTQELTAKDVTRLNNARDILEEQRQKYLVFNRNIFKKTVAEKITKLDQAKSAVGERIDILKFHFDTEIKNMVLFLSEQDFTYTQHLSILETKQKELVGIQEYCTALLNFDLIFATDKIETDITRLTEEINTRFTERTDELAEIEQSLEDATQDVGILLSDELTDEKVAQCHSLLHSTEQSIAEIDAEWKQDTAVNELYDNLDAKAKSLRQTIEDRIFAEVTQIDAVAQQCIRTVDAAALHSPEAVTELLDTEVKLNQLLADYSLLLRHEQTELLTEEQDKIHASLKTASTKITTLKKRLSEEVIEMERQANRDHKYTQDQKELDKDAKKTIELSAYLKALQSDEELGRVETAREEIMRKSNAITERITEKKEELSELHKRIFIEGQEKLEEFWKNIQDDDNIQQSQDLITELQKAVHNQGSWRMDDELSRTFGSIDTALNKLQNYQITQVAKTIDACSFDLMILEQKIQGQHTHQANLIKKIQEDTARVKEIDTLFKKFKKASQEYDVNKVLDATKHILESAEHKYQDARDEITEKVDRILDRVHSREFSRLRHIPELAEMQTQLLEQNELSELVDCDTEHADFLLDYISKEIQRINTSAEKEKETISDTKSKLEYSTKVLFNMLKQPLTAETLKIALKIIETAKREADIDIKEYSSENIEFQIAGLEIKTEKEVESALDSILAAANVYSNQINIPKSRRDMRRLLSIKKKLKQKQEECDAFNQGEGKYAKFVDKAKIEIGQHLTTLDNLRSDHYATVRDVQSMFSKGRKSLLTLLDKANTLETKLKKTQSEKSEEKQDEQRDLTAEYILAVTKLGEKVKTISGLYNTLNCRSSKRDILLLQRIREKAITKQKAVCEIVQKEIDEQTVALMQKWDSIDDDLELKHLCGNLRSKRVMFTQFKNSLLDENVEKAQDLKTAYKTLLQRAIVIKKGHQNGLLKERNIIINLKDKYLDFGEESKKTLTQVMEELPENYIDTIRKLDTKLQAMQQATIEIHNNAPKDRYSQELVTELLSSTEQNTKDFIEYITQIKNALEQKEKLKDTNILKSRSGRWRTGLRKLTKIFTKAPQEHTSDVQELENIRQYHIQVYED